MVQKKSGMKVPFLDLRRQYLAIKKEIDAAIQDVLNSGSFILGENVAKFEEEFAQYCGTKYAIGVANGTDALELALRALEIGRGDEVITTPFTFIATAEAIVAVGAKPIFVDIDLNTYNIYTKKIEKILKKRNKSSKIKAVIPVHLYGQPADMDEIMRISKKYNLKVVEDCAQAVGAEYKGKKVSSFGDCGCFSFFPSKNLGAYGDGGIIVTNKKNIAERLNILRMHGGKDKYHHIIEGRNSRLDELHAAILRVKLKYLDGWNEARRKNAICYNSLFKKNGLNDSIILPKGDPHRNHIYHVYAIRTNRRNDL